MKTPLKHFLKRPFPILMLSLLLIVSSLLLGSCSSRYTSYDAYGLFEGMQEILLAIRIVLGLLGLALLLVGFALYELFIQIIGFLIGGVLGALAGLLLGNDSDLNWLWMLIGFLLGGGIGAALAIFLTYLAVFISGAFWGAAITSAVWMSAFESFPEVWAVIIGALVGGCVLILLFRFWITALTAAIGAALFGASLGLEPVWWLLLFVVGMAVQYGAAALLGKSEQVRPTAAGKKQKTPFVTAAASGISAPAQAETFKQAPRPGLEAPHPPFAAASLGEAQAPPLPGSRAWLEETRTGERFCISDRFLLGRGAEADHKLSDKTVSRRHASFRLAGDTWFIQDQGSSGGTFLNGQRVQAAKLTDGDHIRFGGQEFLFICR